MSLRNLSQRQLSLVRLTVFVLMLVPAIRLLWAGVHEDLGANPIEFITRNTGDWTLYSLCLSLAITPLRHALQWNWLIRLRRMLGLYGFFYACLHFLCFLWFDHFFDWQEMWRDVLKRPFITVGFVSLVLLLPLALTSSHAMVRRLGGKQWQWLHRLVYVIVPLGVLHYFWMKAGKNDVGQPVLFGLLVALLLGARVWRRWRN